MLLVVIRNVYSPGNIMTFVLIVLMPKIAYKEPLTQGKIMILVLITVMPQTTHKDNIMTLLLIANIPQISRIMYRYCRKYEDTRDKL